MLHSDKKDQVQEMSAPLRSSFNMGALLYVHSLPPPPVQSPSPKSTILISSIAPSFARWRFHDSSQNRLGLGLVFRLCVVESSVAGDLPTTSGLTYRCLPVLPRPLGEYQCSFHHCVEAGKLAVGPNRDESDVMRIFWDIFRR